jgi:hypothetical protein
MCMPLDGLWLDGPLKEHPQDRRRSAVLNDMTGGALCRLQYARDPLRFFDELWPMTAEQR